MDATELREKNENGKECNIANDKRKMALVKTEKRAKKSEEN